MERSYEDRNWANDLLYFIKNLWIIGVSTIVGIAMAAGLVAGMAPVYRASATYYLNKSELNSAFFTINEFQFYNLLLLDVEKLMESRAFFEALKAAPVGDYDLEGLTMKDYLEHLYIEFNTDSTFFKVGFDSSNTDLAMDISRRIEHILSREAAKIIRISTVKNVDRTYLGEEPVAPNWKMMILFGAVFGAFLGMSVILIRFLFNDELKTYIEAEALSGKKLLSYSKFNMRKKNIMHMVNSTNNEDYYLVWKTLLNDLEQHGQKLCTVVTCDDTGKNEAFSLTLAHYMGKTFEKTLYIPVNPPKSFSSILTNSYGHENKLIKALNQVEPLSRLIRNVSYSFDILVGTENRVGFNSENLDRFEQLIEELEKTYDLIIISVRPEERLLHRVTQRSSFILAASNNANRKRVQNINGDLMAQGDRFLGIAYQD